MFIYRVFSCLFTSSHHFSDDHFLYNYTTGIVWSCPDIYKVPIGELRINLIGQCSYFDLEVSGTYLSLYLVSVPVRENNNSNSTTVTTDVATTTKTIITTTTTSITTTANGEIQ